MSNIFSLVTISISLRMITIDALDMFSKLNRIQSNIVLRVLYNFFDLNGFLKKYLLRVWSRTNVLKEPHAALEPQVGDPWVRV